MDLDRSSFEVNVDPSTGLTSIDDPSINLSDLSDRQSVLGIYTHVVCSFHLDEQRQKDRHSRDRESFLSRTHTHLESLQNRFVDIELVTEPFIRINTSGVNR